MHDFRLLIVVVKETIQRNALIDTGILWLLYPAGCRENRENVRSAPQSARQCHSRNETLHQPLTPFLFRSRRRLDIPLLHCATVLICSGMLHGHFDRCHCDLLVSGISSLWCLFPVVLYFPLGRWARTRMILVEIQRMSRSAVCVVDALYPMCLTRTNAAASDLCTVYMTDHPRPSR